MLPREIISRSWRPVSGTLSLPGSSKLFCAFLNGNTIIANQNNNNNKTANQQNKNFFFLASSSSSSSAHQNFKNNNALSKSLKFTASCISEEAVIRQTEQNLTRPFVPVIDMPTPLIGDSNPAEQTDQEKSASSGAPQQRGRKKWNPWQVRNRKYGTHLQTLELARARRGPETPAFPDGVPFERVRKQIHMASSSKSNVKYRKHKVYNSLKRGR